MVCGTRSRVKRYGSALLAAGAAGLLTSLLGTVVQPIPQLLFLTAVVFGARTGGLGPGLLATLVGALLTYFLLDPADVGLQAAEPHRLVRLGLFVLLSVLISGIGEKLRQATQTLEESRNIFRSFMDYCPATAFMKDEAGRYVYVNEPFCRAFAISERDWLGKTDQELWPGEWADTYRENDHAVLAANAPREVLECFEREGERSCWLTLKFPFVDRTGRKLLAGMAVDVTERMRLEEELRRRVRQLAEADRRKDEFLATLAHELRNPLAAISNANYVLEEARLPRARAAHLRQVIGHQTQHLIRLVDDLLDVGRITQGKFSLQLRAVELSAVIKAAAESVRPLLRSCRHELTVRLPPEALILRADPDRLEQVFTNLLTNAARYTEAGGKIWLEVAATGPLVTVRVKDTGVGIAPELLDRIFEPFRRGEARTDQSAGGMGIGLALARNLVELHGGTIRVYSEGDGLGSEFIVTLPRGPCGGAGSRAPAAPLPERDSSPAPVIVRAGSACVCPPTGSTPKHACGEAVASSPARVLIVDDNACAAETLAELVELWGHEVLIRTSGEQALASAAEWKPEIVLLDLQLPGIDGYEVARRLRSMTFAPQLHLVALTGYGYEVGDRTREAGFDALLVKPVEPERLKCLLAAG